MSPLSLRCIKAAFACLALGIGLGASFALNRGLGAQLRPLHAELLLWGWATLLIYGMGWHMLPRFAGRPVRWPRAAEAQSWLAIGGVALATLGWLNVAGAGAPGTALRLIGGALQGLAALLFAALIADLLRRRG
ncbi:cbb3-type cytochrome c oxidase subunit I [Kallotenue papyrolyticum]|uniref:cbb3-type cytochrome c oxidase subunit I n=1 Tax=Kallotenue papyrolyticum TaxID=1325125 RepID=UPI000471B4F1|nr:cbb3-type cytochrome c oxidase subunit I [Kallotenue papyrolyticum]